MARSDGLLRAAAGSGPGCRGCCTGAAATGAGCSADEEKGAGGHSPQPQAVAVAAKRKDLHMLVWSSSASPVSERAAVHVFGAGADDHADVLAKGNFFFQSPLALGVTILPLMNKNQQKYLFWVGIRKR